jgi:UDP-3-O-[3-hydroxymyristoyl] glucosamine N-acyltransferase
MRQEPPTWTLGAIAQAIGATVVGDATLPIARPLPAGRPAGPQDLVIAFASDPAKLLAGSGARAALIAEGAPRPEGLAGLLLAARPRVAFARLLQLFEPPPYAPPGVHPSAQVAASAALGEGVSVGPLCVIGADARLGPGCRLLAQVTVGAGTVLGRDCLVHPGVRIGPRVTIGDRVILQPGAVIGADGFSYVTPNPSTIELQGGIEPRVRTRNEPVERLPSLGTVILGDEVEVGANSTIDRATLGATRIGARTKIDNQVQVAHNVTIGEDCLIAGQVGISGSVVIGDRVVLAGQVGVADHRTIGDDAVIAAGGGVANDIPAGEIHLGYPALRKDRKVDEILHIRRLPRMLRDLLDLRQRVASLEKASRVAVGDTAGSDMPVASKRGQE